MKFVFGKPSIAGFCLAITLLTTLQSFGAPVREDLDDLTEEMGQFRRGQIESVAYTLHFKLAEKGETFGGRATLDVKLHDATAPLSIDLNARSLDEVTVNGKVVNNIVKREGSFDIPPEHLNREPMKIGVVYTGEYSNTGEGLCHFTDPVDEREYLYTNLEPYGAHKVIPCFDQPDIKATYTMTVEAPEGWVVIGNMTSASKHVGGGVQTVVFKPTPPLSTYLFFLGGGDYQAWHDVHQGMPLAMYVRASMAKHFDAERLFAETKAGLDYFNAFFDFPYPFDKYDHIFAPELGPGAMENPGAVTMNEYMIFRGEAKAEDYRNRNNILLHEMAHMWFGDLVTMAWWNDLWLNESFATFSSYLAQHSMTQAPAIWRDFYGLKGWAYHQDQLSTTHPVEVAVPSARLALDNFDGITYAKGASALKQLWFKVGPEAYQQGVAAYFKKFAWQNATRAQFMDSIAEASGRDLGSWTEAWLKTEGLSQIAVEFTCEDDTIKNFSIEQSPVNAPRLSPHHTQIAFFQREAGGGMVPGGVVSADFHTESTALPFLIGKPCPDFVYPNYGDMDYGLFFLDPRSYETVLEDIAALEEPFLRQMVWGTLYTMVREQRLGASEFMALLLTNLRKETALGVLEYLLGGRMLNETLYHFLAPDRRDAIAPRLEEVLWAGRANAEAGSDERLLWHDAAVSLAARPEAMERLRPLLDAATLDQPRRWSVVGKLAQLGASDAVALIDAELKRDPTAQGERIAFGLRGSIPTVEAKEAQWKRLADPELSLSRQRAASGSFHNPLHPELTELFVDSWFEAVHGMDWEAEQHRLGIWFDNLIPPIYTPDFLKRSRTALASAQLPPRARRAWREANDQIERVIAIRAYDHRSNATP